MSREFLQSIHSVWMVVENQNDKINTVPTMPQHVREGALALNQRAVGRVLVKMEHQGRVEI
jgi:hypothetical protein